ncbi:MAG TPA: 5'-nucleotidase C-terminal domain-containing protein [Gemmatimonadaceae bacterium]|nr:5'-nucleotidase C-terminal domain-containing protein [Gemmatimonadaceae bacterium]
MRSIHPFLLALALGSCASQPRAPRVGGTAERELVIAATTDVHGRLRGWDYYGDVPDSLHSLARAATIVDSLRTAHGGLVVLVDAGDLLQGNPLAFVAARVTRDTLSPVIAAMNAMHYDAAAVGNHEFNYGVPHLERAVAQASFPFLAANAYRVSGERAFPGWLIVQRGGISVGIVGATTPGSLIWDRDNLAGRIVIHDAVPLVRAAVDSARAAGADVVIVVAHSGIDGGSSYDEAGTGIPSENFIGEVARTVPGIDLIVFGHSHREVADSVIGGAMLMQPGNWARSVAVAHLTVRRDGDRWSVVSRRSATLPTAGRVEQAGVLAASRAAHEETVRYVTSPIGSTPVAWRGDSARVRDTPLIDLILEVQRRASGAELASTAAFSLGARLGPGPITMADVARLYPYDNTLRAIRITGRQLRDYLEHSARYFRGPDAPLGAVDATVPGYNFDIVSGIDYTIDLSRPIGSRITRLVRGARVIGDDDSFTLALNNYRQSGGGGFAMLAGAPVVYDRQEDVRQLLIDEVRRRGTIRPEDYFTPNWRIEPAGAVGAAYEAMHGRGSAAAPATGAPVAAREPIGLPRLRIISTNDFHGALEPRPDAEGVRRGGAGALASAIARARAECRAPACETILLDGGDMLQGTPASNLAHGVPVVELYHALDYAAAAVGNHEFDWGVDTLRARMRQARHRFLAANVRYADGSDVEWIPNDTIVQRGALRIGVIGLATQSTPQTTRARNVAGLRFDPPTPIVDSIARALRARGANAIVVVAHAGGFCNAGQACDGEIFQLARTAGEPIDAIVSGHSHSRVATVVAGIPIVQAIQSGRAIGIIDVPLDAPGEAPRVAVRDVLTDSLPPSPRIDSLVRHAIAAVAPLVEQPVARLAEPLLKSGEQYPLGHIVADAQRWAGEADVAVMNNGGIRTGVPGGAVTYGHLFEVQPFGNTLYRLELRGSELRAYLERSVRRNPPRVHVSGLTVTFDITRAPGARILSVMMSDGRPLDDGRTYSLVINDFMVTGGDGLGLEEQGITAVPLDLVDLDVLIDYLRSRPQPVQPPRERRLIAVPQ